MSRRSNSVRRSAIVVAALALLALPLIFWGTARAIRDNTNDFSDWLPAEYEETRQYRVFQQHFGSEDFVVVSWPGCELDSPQLTRFAEVLDEQTAAAGKSALIRRITTGTQVVDQLSSPPASLSLDDAVERLQGTLIGPDGKQTCALVTLSPEGRKSLRRSIDAIRAATAEVGLPPDDVRLGGPPVINDAIDRASADSLARLSGLAAAIGIAVALSSFRSMRLTAIVFAVSVFSTLAALALVPASGMKLNAVVVTMVPLVYVAAMSGAIHFVNYYLEEQRHGVESPIWQALLKAVLPLVLAAVTTSVGLLSLLYSDLAPIREFGAFSAAGVVVAFAVQLTLLPALLELFAGQNVLPKSALPNSEDAEPAENSVWVRIAQWGIHRQLAIKLGVIALLLVAAVGLSRVTTSIQIMRLFGSGNRVLVDYAWLEKHLGGLVPMEVVLQFDRRSPGAIVERLKLVEDLAASVTELPEVGGCLTAATFTPRVPENALWIRRFATERLIARARPKLLATGLVADAGEGEAWRVSVRVDSSGDPDYGLLYGRLKQHIESFVAQHEALPQGDPQVMVTGAVPILFKARRSLLNGMTLGLVMDVALVCVAIAVLLRSAAHGLLLAVISLLPVMTVFGSMGLTGIVVDIGSVMAPCVALGVTVDDVIHWLLWYDRGRRQGLPSQQSVQLAHSHCAQPMFQSWGVIGLGLTVFTLSPFVPTFRFGVLMVLLLTVNLLSNLFVLPALVLFRSTPRPTAESPAISPHSADVLETKDSAPA